PVIVCVSMKAGCAQPAPGCEAGEQEKRLAREESGGANRSPLLVLLRKLPPQRMQTLAIGIPSEGVMPVLVAPGSKQCLFDCVTRQRIELALRRIGFACDDADAVQDSLVSRREIEGSQAELASVMDKVRRECGEHVGVVAQPALSKSLDRLPSSLAVLRSVVDLR